MAAPTLALPSAGGSRQRNVLSVAALLASAGGLMLFGALVGAYIHVRRFAEPWPPEEASLDNYLGNMLVITMLLSSVTIEWAAAAARRGVQKQAVTGYAITIGLGLAFLNLLWYTGANAHYGAATHAYGTVVATMAFLLGTVVALGIAFAALTLFRVLGSQVSASDPDQARAVGWYWQFTVVATVAVWFPVVMLK